MKRIFTYLIVGIIIHLLGCSSGFVEKTYVEKIVTNQGAVVEVNGARFEIPPNSISDSILVRFGKHVLGKQPRSQGFVLLGESYVIEPETLVFKKPIEIVCPVKSKNAGLGVRVGKGFVPLANAEVNGETLTAALWHGGEYVLIQRPNQFGIVEHTKTKEGLLIVSDIYVGDYISNLKKVLRQNGYDLPVWIFRYDHRETIETNARLLSEGLKTLHDEYGAFRMDVVSFGIGGLVTHRYLTDSSYYQRDISSAVIAIGTPFLGSNFADPEYSLIGISPFRFFFIDAMGDGARALMPGSEFVSRVQKTKHMPGFHYYDDPTENKNFVSLRGHKVIDGNLPEEISGDGLVSMKSAMLTAIEPAVFELNHFDLFESQSVHEVATDFVLLYRSYSWPMLFSAVWQGREPYSKINSIWEREINLHFRDDTDFDVLIEYNMNMLNSAPQNAILITNGDYDTYPSWYLQEKGVRQDVIIVNRSLLNLKDYARYLKQRGLPLGVSEDRLEEIQHRKDEDGIVTVSDQLMQFLLKQKNRPVVFSTTVYQPERYGFPLKLSGLVYEISESDIDIARTKELLFKDFEFKRLFSRPLDSVDVNLRNMIVNYAAIAFRLAGVLEDSGEYSEAIEMLEFARRFAEEPMFYYNEARLYFKMGAGDRATEMLERLLRIEVGDTRLVKEVAKMYHANDMPEKAVSLLAGLLRDNPKDKEITDLIRKYQGE
ncbi:MAG: tetratricopeptide repeat protein [candidate division WOR-3 bacterium]|nr:MAG: tetratricopeptide repeat protein [candidate division WOR-3 bacterium]